MKTPAEKCAERIVSANADRDGISIGTITAIIQSEYAPTIQVAREAMEGAEDALSEFGAHKDETRTGIALRLLRTALDLLTPPQQRIKTMGEMK